MAVASNTPIPIPSGWTLAKHLKKGDYVFSKDGLPIQIVSTHEYTPTKCYTVTLNDGVYVDLDPHAKFPIRTIFNRQSESRPNKNLRTRKRIQKFANVEQMLERGLIDKNGYSFYSVENTAPIQYPTEDHPVPPFIAGMWMTRRNPNSRFTVHPSMEEYIKTNIKDCGWSFVQKKKGLIDLRPSIRTSFLTRYARVPTLLPDEYYFGSIDQRIELLRGLIALRPTSYDKKKDRFFIFSMDIRFLICIQGVCESLGMKTTVFHNATSISHQLTFRTNIQLHPEQEASLSLRNSVRRTIRKINEIEPVPCVHIETKEAFVIGQGFLPIWH
jgi:hypothetical protein